MTDEISEDVFGEAEFLAHGLPRALAKACNDQFDYAMGLSNGQIIRFEQGTISEDYLWVHVRVHGAYGDNSAMEGVPFSFERGLDVRVSEIVWIADAPNGS